MFKGLISPIFLLLAATNQSHAADYIVPYEYDNMVQSVKSHGYGVITQSSALSTTTWNIGGNAVRYRCLSIPKISCSSATAVPSANVSEKVLTKPNAVVANQKAVFPLIYDLRYEDAGANWNICGAAIGGVMYDNIDYSGGQLTYTPNQYSETYVYFTDIAITNSTAYMTFTYHQTCQ